MIKTSDFTIYDSAWIIEAESDPFKARALEREKQIGEALLKFFLENNVFNTKDRWEGFSDWGHFKFMKSDLTPLGYELVRQCHDKWLGKIDRTGKIDMIMWEKALSKLRGGQ